MSRKIEKIIIHCSATNGNQDISTRDIDRWHKERGWSGIGYHFVIKRSGTLEKGRDLEEIGSHCKGLNKTSIGICLIGGIDKNGNAENNFTVLQFITLEKCLRNLKNTYPQATIHGHREFADKDCPSFDVQKWLQENGLRNANQSQ